MKIQWIKYAAEQNNTKLKDNDLTINDFSSPSSLGDFDINIIDFNNEFFWINNGMDTNRVNDIKHLCTMKDMIQNCKDKVVIILLPSNLIFKYSYDKFNRDYKHKVPIKNELENVMNIVNVLSLSLNLICIYNKTITTINGVSYSSDFVIKSNDDQEIIHFNDAKDSIVTTQNGNIIYSSLLMDNEELLLNFINDISLSKDSKTPIPSWFSGIHILKDKDIAKSIEEEQEIIKVSENKIRKYEQTLEKNNYYKSILYETGDILQKIVWSMLTHVLEYKEDTFLDEKKEDFLIDLESITFIGEVKGIQGAVKRTNISQVMYHSDLYSESLPEESINTKVVKPILVANHQREVSLEEREKIKKEHVDYAIKNNVLIIESPTLLKIYEKYELKELDKNQVLEILSENVGVLKI